MQNRQAATFFERGRLRQPCASAPQKWCIDRSWPFGSSVGFGVAGNGAEHVVERSRRTINSLIENSSRRRIQQAVKRRLAIDCDRPSSEAIHSRITRAAAFTLADYRLELKCTSLRGWSLFRGAIPSSARSPESSRIYGATLHLENEPAPSARQQASCLPSPPWPPHHRALRPRIWRSLRLCAPRRA